jgi:hypothetical protein
MAHTPTVYVYLPGEVNALAFDLSELLTERILALFPARRQGFRILLSPIAHPAIPELISSADQAQPPLLNLDPEIGYLMLTVKEADQVIYRHAHSIDDLIRAPLLARLRHSHPIQSLTAIEYALDLGLTGSVKPTPTPHGRFTVPPQTKRRSGFQVRAIPDPDLAPASLADWGIETAPTAERHAPVTIILTHEVADLLRDSRPFSDLWEEGGFLIGWAFRDVDHSAGHIVEIVAAPSAEHTGGSLIHLDFTGDSFSQLKRQLAHDYPDALLLGWYHTHLFPATDAFGLSALDVNLHRTTFKRPWQIAGLINLPIDGTRTLRFYSICSDDMVLCPHYVAESVAGSTRLSGITARPD